MTKLTKLCLIIVAFVSLTFVTAQGQVWLNEFHYDNDGADVAEFIEFAIDSSLDVSLVSVVLYNGSTSTSYDSHAGNTFLAGESLNGFTIYSLAIAGIQNGAPDGIAIGYNGSLVRFFSYEGAFTGSGGIADGVLSTDIGVDEEPAPLAAGGSLGLVGTGSQYSDFTWTTFAGDSPGFFNPGQTVVPEPATWAMIALGGGLLLGVQRLRRKK